MEVWWIAQHMGGDRVGQDTAKLEIACRKVYDQALYVEEQTSRKQLLPRFAQIKLRPFSTRLPNIRRIADYKTPRILIGSTTLVELASRSPQYKNTVFFNKSTFRPSLYAEAWQEHALNSVNLTVRFKHLPNRPPAWASGTGQVFARINDDSKQWSGGVLVYDQLLETRDRLKSRRETQPLENWEWDDRGLLSLDSVMFLAPVREIEEEYRFVVVDRRIVAGSRYQPQPAQPLDETYMCWAWAQERIEKIDWAPHAIYTLDVCLTPKGYKMLECNCFNASGLYACDRTAVVQTVSQWQVAH